jgi:hypothetical protein
VLPTDDSDADAYWKGISLQAEARAARFAVSDKSGYGAAIMGDEWEKRISRRLSRDWALTIALGFALCAAVVIYLTLGVHPHSPV